MGVYNCQLFNNLGLCCFYAQQYDMTLTSFERALSLAENEEEAADVWYNLGHIAVVCCLHVSLLRIKLPYAPVKKFSDVINPTNNLEICGSHFISSSQIHARTPHLAAVVGACSCHVARKC